MKFFKADIISSFVVFIVAMPLSMGIALASGASLAAGLITAIIGGIVGGLFAGAPLTVTGPAAGMTALVFQLIQSYGIRGLAVITVMAGLMQIIFGIGRAGGLFRLIPQAVLEGVLTAIGAIIVLGQLHVLVGADLPKSISDGILTLPQVLQSAESAVIFCGILAIVIQLLWRKLSPIKWIPAALPAVVSITALSLLWQMPRVEFEALLPLMQSSTTDFFSFGWLQKSMIFLVPAFGVALVASAESLLTARAVDTLVKDQSPPANLNKELFAQGAANVLSGAFGGLPMTAVMVRSAANVDSGARTRLSTMLHGLWIAAFVGLLPQVISKVPLTVLAAVLILTGYKLINVQGLWKEFSHNRREGFLWMGTAFLILATDLLTGLVASLVLATFVNAKEIFSSFKKGSAVQPSEQVLQPVTEFFAEEKILQPQPIAKARTYEPRRDQDLQM